MDTIPDSLPAEKPSASRPRGCQSDGYCCEWRRHSGGPAYFGFRFLRYMSHRSLPRNSRESR